MQNVYKIYAEKKVLVSIGSNTFTNIFFYKGFHYVRNLNSIDRVIFEIEMFEFF